MSATVDTSILSSSFFPPQQNMMTDTAAFWPKVLNHHPWAPPAVFFAAIVGFVLIVMLLVDLVVLKRSSDYDFYHYYFGKSADSVKSSSVKVSTVVPLASNMEEVKHMSSSTTSNGSGGYSEKSSIPRTNSFDEEDIDGRFNQGNNDNRGYSNIDLVLYLERTGSIIELSKLMDKIDDFT